MKETVGCHVGWAVNNFGPITWAPIPTLMFQVPNPSIQMRQSGFGHALRQRVALNWT